MQLRATQHPECAAAAAACRAINVPTRLVEALKQQQERCGKQALLIHISTDQVRMMQSSCSCSRCQQEAALPQQLHPPTTHTPLVYDAGV